jgi:hypothetical protein
MLSSGGEGEKRAPPEALRARYLEAMELHRRGVSERGISRALSINRATVRKFIHAQGFPERAPKKRRGSTSSRSLRSSRPSEMGPRAPHNALQPWREIMGEGPRGGKAAMVRSRYVGRLRAELLAELAPEQRACFLGINDHLRGSHLPSVRRGGY